MKISIIIPTFNDERSIHATLEDIYARHSPYEVIVVDGGSNDRTVYLAKEWTEVFKSQKGRAKQMNEGARCATGDVLLFLRADAKLPSLGLRKIKDAIRIGAEAGRFPMSFGVQDWRLRLYARITQFRFFTYGEQVFFIKRDLFEKLQGFREGIPYEEPDFFKRLKTYTDPVLIQDAVLASGRRYLDSPDRQNLLHFFWGWIYYLSSNFLRTKRKSYPDIR
jgi:glycosyltransferase involved in cell wall biosynthesis